MEPIPSQVEHLAVEFLWNTSAYLALFFELWRHPSSDAVLTPAISSITGRPIDYRGQEHLILSIQAQRASPLPFYTPKTSKKNTCCGNEMLPQTLHISYKDHVTNEEVCANIQQAMVPHKDFLTIVEGHKLKWYRMSPIHQVWPNPSCKAQWRKEDKADRKRGGKTTSRNEQAWSLPSPRGQWRTEKWGKLVVKSSVVPQRH